MLCQCHLPGQCQWSPGAAVGSVAEFHGQNLIIGIDDHSTACKATCRKKYAERRFYAWRGAGLERNIAPCIQECPAGSLPNDENKPP